MTEQQKQDEQKLNDLAAEMIDTAQQITTARAINPRNTGPLGTPVNGISTVQTGAPNVNKTHEIRDLVMNVLQNELCTEESTDILIRVITAPLPVGVRTVVGWALDKVLPQYLISAIRHVLYRDIPAPEHADS
jgi:hypothetical protein